MNQWEKRTRRQYKSSGARQIEANCTHLPASSSEQPDASRPQGGQRISAFGAQRPNLIERQSEVSAGPVLKPDDPREIERERDGCDPLCKQRKIILPGRFASVGDRLGIAVTENRRRAEVKQQEFINGSELGSLGWWCYLAISS